MVWFGVCVLWIVLLLLGLWLEVVFVYNLLFGLFVFGVGVVVIFVVY